MEDETIKKSNYGKYILYGFGGILLILTMINFAESAVSGTDYKTFWLLSGNASDVGVNVNGHPMLNISITANTTSSSQNISLGTTLTGSYWNGTVSNGEGSVGGNGTFYTPNFSIPPQGFQSINGTWEVSVITSCSGGGAAFIQFQLFKYNSTGEYNLTQISGGIGSRAGVINATVADFCVGNALSAGINNGNLSVMIPAQFDTGFTNLTGNDRIGLRINLWNPASTNANNATIRYNNTGSFLKVTNVTTQPKNRLSSFQTGYPQLNSTNLINSGKNFTSAELAVIFIGSDSDEGQTLKYSTQIFKDNVSVNKNIINQTYTNGTLVYNLINRNNLSSDHTYLVQVTLNDGTSEFYANTSELLIINDTNGTTHYPTNFSNNQAVGTVAWSTLSNVYPSDDAYVTTTLLLGQQSNYLVLGNFSINIPANAVNVFTQIQLERKAGLLSDITDTAVRLVKDGVIGSADRSSAGTWGTSDTVITYGGNRTDSWGWILNSTGTNNHTYAVAISVSASSADTASIDAVNITTFYETSIASSNSCTYSSGDFIVNCFDNCSISSIVQLNNNNLILNGAGSFTVTSAGGISNFNQLFIEGTSLNQCVIYDYSGSFLG